MYLYFNNQARKLEDVIAQKVVNKPRNMEYETKLFLRNIFATKKI